MQHTAAVHSAIEAERERAQRAKYARLTAHYGKISSGALKAALIHAQKNKPAKTLGPKPA